MSDGLLAQALRRPGPLVTVELRPPRADLEASAGIGAWIDLHHKGYDPLSLGRLFADVHWCPKDRGGVRP